MHEAALAEAALPQPAVINGIPLRPYSLGHELCLIREASPFVSGEKPTSEHLFKAIWICCNSWVENKTAAEQWLGPLKVRLLCRRFKRANIDQCIEQFTAYRKSGCLQFRLSEIPRPVSREGGSRRMAGSPFLLMVQMFLVEHYRLSDEQAWDYPAGLAKMRWQTYWEQQNGLDIYNDQDAKFDAYRERREREKREAKLKGGS